MGLINWQRIFRVMIVITLAGCSNNESSNVLPVNKMKLVLWDLLQADEFSIRNFQKDSSLNINAQTNLLYQKVFSLHKVDGKDFFQSFDFYKTHPDQFKVLLDSVSSYGNRQRDSTFYKSRMTPVKKIL